MKAEQGKNKTKIKELEELVVRHFIYCRRGGGEERKIYYSQNFQAFSIRRFGKGVLG
jgi:hypothetical protein